MFDDTWYFSGLPEPSITVVEEEGKKERTVKLRTR